MRFTPLLGFWVEYGLTVKRLPADRLLGEDMRYRDPVRAQAPK